MSFNPYSINHVPRYVPIWHQLMEELNNPEPKRLAKVLGVGVRTIYRYNATGRAPKASCLALYWLTSWGRADVHAQAVADCQLAVGYFKALERENKVLKVKVTHLLALGGYGAANDPTEGIDHVRLR